MWKLETEEEAKGVIILVHGALEHHGRYKWLAEMWRLNGFDVIMGDLPGQGTTTRSRRGHIESFDEYINEVDEWIREATKWEIPIFILGHSMGGLITIRLLQEKKWPLAGVVLSSPCLGLLHPPSKFMDALSYGLNVVSPKLRLNPKLTVESATRNLEIQRSDQNDSLFVTRVSVRWYRELVAGIKWAHEKIDDTLDVPLLVMQGAEDKIVDKNSVFSWFNQLQMKEKHYKEWNKCYHEIFSEPEREIVFQYTKDFVEARLRSLGYYIK